MPQMTTSQPDKRPLFEPPENVINEPLLYSKLNQNVTPATFSELIASNFLMSMVAHDRRVTRDVFEDVMVTAFNFQNRLVRISELHQMLERLAEGQGFGTTVIKNDVARHMESALSHRDRLLETLKLFGEMRGKEDSVS
jgi:hypothetical protein